MSLWIFEIQAIDENQNSLVAAFATSVGVNGLLAYCQGLGDVPSKNHMLFWSFFLLHTSDQNINDLIFTPCKYKTKDVKANTVSVKTERFKVWIVTEMDTTELDLNHSSLWFLS